MIIQSILLFAETHPEAVAEPLISVASILSVAISFFMVLFSWWIKSSSDRKYSENKEAKKDEIQDLKDLKLQVYKNKDDIFKNTLHDERSSEDNKRMQESIDKMTENIIKLTEEVLAVKGVMMQLKVEKEKSGG